MPDFASRRLAVTSCVLLPIDETMPIPVRTTRLMIASSACVARALRTPLGPGRLRLVLEQPDLEVECPIDNGAVHREPAVRDAQDQFRAHHALEVDAVDDLPHGRLHLTGQLHFAHAERTSAAGGTEPAEE